VTTPTLLWGLTNNYLLMYSDKGSDADMNGSFYRPQPSSGFILGDYGQGNYNAPIGPTFYISGVENDDPDNPALMPAIGCRQVYNDTKSGADMNGSFWILLPPDGYTAIGHVSQNGYTQPVVASYRCVRSDLVTQTVVPGPLIWSDEGSGATENVSIYAMGFLNVIFANPGYAGVSSVVPILVPTLN
jgi:hypothetical protein